MPEGGLFDKAKDMLGAAAAGLMDRLGKGRGSE